MARPKLNPWRETVRLSEVARGPLRRRLSPQAPQLAAIARVIGVDVLKSLTAEVTVTPWLDGAELRGRFEAEVTQTCGVTLDPLEQEVRGDFLVRVLPAGSQNLPSEEADAAGLARYVAAARDHLAARPLEQVLAGSVSWPAPK